MNSANDAPREVPNLLRLYDLTMDNGQAHIVGVADPDIIMGGLMRPFVLLPTWRPATKSWVCAVYGGAHIASLIPRPVAGYPALGVGAVPVPPVSVAGVATGTGDDTVLIDHRKGAPSIVRLVGA